MRVKADLSQPDAAEYMVSIRDLTKRYTEGGETRSVLRGVNADIHEGSSLRSLAPAGRARPLFSISSAALTRRPVAT